MERELPATTSPAASSEGARKAASGSCMRPAKRNRPMVGVRAAPIELVYHSDQRWGTYFDVGIGDRAVRFTQSALSPTRRIPSRSIRVRVALRDEKAGDAGGSAPVSSGRRSSRTGELPRWTRSRSDQIFQAARDAIDDHAPAEVCVHAGAQHRRGVSIAELDPLAPVTDSQMANAAVASIDYNRPDDSADCEHRVEAASASAPDPAARKRSLHIELSGQGTHWKYPASHRVQATGMAGAITGHPPLFERFALGDSTTLRGWDKFDIAPAGGDHGTRRSSIALYGNRALPRHRFGLGRQHRTTCPRVDGSGSSTRGRVLRRWLPGTPTT